MRRAPVALFLLTAVLVAACLSATPTGGTGTTPPATSAAPSVDAGTPGASSDVTQPSSQPATSSAPQGSPEASSPSASTPAASDTVPSDSAGPTASESTSPAAACQPEGSNPNFWPGMATSVTWDVYCAVLPKGWYVSTGSYRLANGGKLEISYKGPGGATLSLSEGSFCTDGTGCVPSGTDAGSASFGALSGTLVAVDSGGYAIVVDRGQTPSWLMTTTGLDQATTVSLAGALARVGG